MGKELETLTEEERNGILPVIMIAISEVIEPVLANELRIALEQKYPIKSVSVEGPIDLVKLAKFIRNFWRE